MKNLYQNLTDEEQMEIDFAMMKEDGTYDILFPEPTDEDLIAMAQEMGEDEDEEDFFIPEKEDYEKYEKEMGEIPL